MLVMSVFALMCGMTSIIGADNKVAQQPQYSELINAAQTLPTKYGIDHLCIKQLEEALMDFQAEENLHGKGHGIKDARALANGGIWAMRGAKFLLVGLINGLNKEKSNRELLVQENSSLTERLIRANKTHEEQIQHEQRLLSTAQKSLTGAHTKISELQNQQSNQQPNEDHIREVHAQFTAMRIQRNIMAGAFIVSVMAFLTYFLRVNYASVA